MAASLRCPFCDHKIPLKAVRVTIRACMSLIRPRGMKAGQVHRGQRGIGSRCVLPLGHAGRHKDKFMLKKEREK